MAIPETPLVLSVDPDSMTLNDLELFESGGFKVSLFKQFMGRHSNWTPEQVGLVTVREMTELVAQIADQLKGAAVPKASS